MGGGSPNHRGGATTILGRVDMSEVNGNIVDFGIDGLNATTGSRDGNRLFTEVYDLHRDRSESEGWTETLGRKGNYTTNSINSMMLGRDPDRGLWLSTMGASTKALPLAELCQLSSFTRCDLQVTWMQISKSGGLIPSQYRKLISEVQSLPSEPYLALTQSASGSTLYYGKRTNGFLGRLYDKGGQSGLAEPGWLFRMEWEYRKKQAQAMQKALVEWDCNPERIRDWVIHEAYKRGFDMPTVAGAVETQPDFWSDEPDAFRTLRWLATGVKPAVEKLIAEGHSEAIKQIFEGVL